MFIWLQILVDPIHKIFHSHYAIVGLEVPSNILGIELESSYDLRTPHLSNSQHALHGFFDFFQHFLGITFEPQTIIIKLLHVLL